MPFNVNQFLGNLGAVSQGSRDYDAYLRKQQMDRETIDYNQMVNDQMRQQIKDQPGIDSGNLKARMYQQPNQSQIPPPPMPGQASVPMVQPEQQKQQPQEQPDTSIGGMQETLRVMGQQLQKEQDPTQRQGLQRGMMDIQRQLQQAMQQQGGGQGQPQQGQGGIPRPPMQQQQPMQGQPPQQQQQQMPPQGQQPPMQQPMQGQPQQQTPMGQQGQLDISKLSPQQMQMLAQQNPQALQQGIQNFQRQQQQAQQQPPQIPRYQSMAGLQQQQNNQQQGQGQGQPQQSQNLIPPIPPELVSQLKQQGLNDRQINKVLDNYENKVGQEAKMKLDSLREARAQNHEEAIENNYKSEAERRSAQSSNDIKKLQEKSDSDAAKLAISEKRAETYQMLSSSGNSKDLTPSGEKVMNELIESGKPVPKIGRQLNIQALNSIGKEQDAGGKDIVQNIQDTQSNQKTLNDFASGKSAMSSKSINAVSEHVDVVRGIATALDNGDVQMYNKYRNQWGKAFGATLPENMDAAAPIIGSEIVKAIVPTGGGVAEREEAEKKWNTTATKGQILSNIDNVYIPLIKGQAEALNQQYSTTGRKDYYSKYLTEKTRKSLGLQSEEPKGKSMVFKDAKELQDAIKSGKVKKGDTFNDPDGNSHVVN